MLSVLIQSSASGVNKGVEKKSQLLQSDVSQAWFTSRDDKNMLQSSGMGVSISVFWKFVVFLHGKFHLVEAKEYLCDIHYELMFACD